jgi:hypothetical protein
MPENLQYIARAGGLAVALGLGVLVANTPCLASADPDEPSASSSADSSGSAAKSSANSSDGAASSGSNPSTTSSGTPGGSSSESTPGDTTNSSENQSLSPTSGYDGESNESSSEIDPSSGSTHTGSTNERSGVAAPANETTPQTHFSDEAASADSAAGSARHQRRVASNVQRQAPLVATGTGGDRIDPRSASPSATRRSSRIAVAESNPTSPVQPRAVTSEAVVRVASPSVGETDSAVTQAVAGLTSGPATPSTVVSGIVPGVLAWVGLSPFASDTPAAPIESPGLLVMLAAARREGQQTLSGETSPAAKSVIETSQPLAEVAAAAAVAAAPPAFVQVNSVLPQTNQSSVQVVYAGAQTAGDTNILAIGWNNATSNVTSVTDSAGNVYQAAVPTARGAGLSQTIYYAKNIKAAAAGANTVTVTFDTATPYVDVRATEYSGLDAADPFDVGTSASGTGASANSGTVTTTAPGLVFGAGMTTGNFAAAGTGFSTRIITNPDADIVQDRAVSTAGAYNATASLSGSSAWVMQVATFKAASTAT